MNASYTVLRIITGVFEHPTWTYSDYLFLYNWPTNAVYVGNSLGV